MDASEQIRMYVEAYESGIYTQDELVGVVLDILVVVPDFEAVWGDVPDYAQKKIRDFLGSCNESTVLYNASAKSHAPISPRLLSLKEWLASG